MSGLISTSETTVHYPSDFVARGGPALGAYGAPKALEDWQDYGPVVLILAQDCKTWQIVHGDYVIVESTNKKDIAQYFLDLMQAVEDELLS